MTSASDRPRLLIEDWLPVAQLGIESKRERKVFTDLPPLNYLHLWWARRPIVASQAVVLAGLLPPWSERLSDEFPIPATASRDAYQAWFLRLVGIVGDPIAGAKAEAAGQTGKAAFGYPQAWKNSPDPKDVTLLHSVLRATWGELPNVADPTAGGGAIPFAAARYGLSAYANDLNSVAATILQGGVQFPAQFGPELASEAEKWSEVLAQRLEERMRPFFPRQVGENLVAVLYAYSVPCPRTGLPVPLFPNLWLDRSGSKLAVKIATQSSGFTLELVKGPNFDFDPSSGTLKGGSAISPYDSLVIEGDHIKKCAQEGLLKPFPYAVLTRTAGTGGRRAGPLTFRLPTEQDQEAIKEADAELRRNRVSWEADGSLPNEECPPFIPKHDVRPYGFTSWDRFFTSRQLLTHVAFVQEYRLLADELRRDLGGEKEELADAVLALICLMHGKMLDYNSRMSAWNVGQQSVRNGFESHAFGFKSTFAEKMAPGDLLRWASKQVIKAARVSGDLIRSSRPAPSAVEVTRGSGATLRSISDSSITHLCMDPPYYDNVMYGELSDFFHVWHKRTYGQIRPDLWPSDLADQENEAVANIARFSSHGRRRAELARADYQAKMSAIFTECHRVLSQDGVLTVMFTHKKAEAWDTLGVALMDAGFVIEASWPVNTEFEYSTHQANVNAASSTIMLVCRKKLETSDGRLYLEDIASTVRQAARDAVLRFEQAGIQGVDLMLAAYGPALSVVSMSWPVYSSDPDHDGLDQLLRPEEALNIAREEVVAQRRARLVGRAVQVDDSTDFVLMAWDQFQAREFPYDAARLLALAVGGQDVDDLVHSKILSKKAGTVALCTPKQRLRRSGDADAFPGVRPDAMSFSSMLDALDTVLYVAEVDGLGPAKALMDRAKLTDDPRFLAAVQGMVNAMPRVKTKDGWSVPEAGLLDSLCSVHLPAITRPDVIDLTAEPAQDALFDKG